MASLEQLLKEIENLGDYDLHDILRRQKKVEWCHWHLNIDNNVNAIRIAEKFHQEIEKKLKTSPSIVRDIDTIKRTFLELLSIHSKELDAVKTYFKQARKENSPIPILKAYTVDQNLTKRLHIHSAVNTHHTLKLYCTLLNCPVLAQTQEYTEAFTRILFHSDLNELLVPKMEVYRGARLEDKKLVDNYKEGATIITTTFLSTSADRAVAEVYCDIPPGNMNMVSLFCTFNINNTHRHTALDLRDISIHPEEEEILIFRYISFKIRSVERKDNGRRIKIYFDECEEQCTVEETHF